MMDKLTLKENLIIWMLLLVTGGIFAGFFFMWNYVNTLRNVTVSPGIGTRWEVPVQFVGEDFDHLQLCQEQPTIDSSEEGLINLYAWYDDIVEIQQVYLSGPTSLTYEIDKVSVGPYWSLKPPDMTFSINVRLEDSSVKAPAVVDLEVYGCAAISASYWKDQEDSAAKTLDMALKNGDPATISRARTFINELRERKDLLAQAHHVKGSAHFEIQSQSGFRAFILTAGYYVLAGLLVISGLIFGYCILYAILRLKAG